MNKILSGLLSGLAFYGLSASLVNAAPSIDIEKLTNGVDGDTADQAVVIAPGDIVAWSYQVTNTGDVGFAFADIVITDDNGTPGDTSDDFGTAGGIVFDGSDSGTVGILDPGELWLYEAMDVAQDLAGLIYENFATVTATPPIGTGGGTVTDTDLSHYLNPPGAGVPEPTTLVLMCLGLAGIGYRKTCHLISGANMLGLRQP